MSERLAQPPTAPRGTHDILPEEQPYWAMLFAGVRRTAERYGYQRIDTPIFEDSSVYLRTTGDSTDIVRKEMYLFEDRGGETLALRAEGTAGVCRAYLEHGMSNRPQPLKLYYISPVFRYDRPQAGRYRQHHQFGVEAIGDEDPLLDAEVIDLLRSFYQDLGLRDYRLFINSIGDAECRPRYLEVLRAYYADKLDLVDQDCRDRYERNPMRLLDCKNERCQPVIAGAPVISEHLCGPCREHFASLRRYLDVLAIPYEHAPHLVRGLDYYTRTVFEYQPLMEGGQSTLGGGGRYDGLIELLGGRATPGVGFGCGLERVIINLKREEIPAPPAPAPLLYVAFTGDGADSAALDLARAAREAGVATTVGSSNRSLKAQMRNAASSGAAFAAIIGARELAEGMVTLRDLAHGGEESLRAADLIGRLQEGERGGD